MRHPEKWFHLYPSRHALAVRPMSDPTPISARDLLARLSSGEPLQLVDVREAAELELAQLPHPVLHLPLSEAERWVATIQASLSHEQPVVVLCHAGIRSRQMGRWLIEQQGYTDVWNLEGGIDAWSVTVDPRIPRY
jgi:rhodanese-related sulfurtransferase